MKDTDGFSMEEQKELRNNYYNSLPKIHLTTSFQAKSADRLIGELQRKLGAAEAYILELEETKSKEIKALKNELTAVKKERDKIMRINQQFYTNLYKDEKVKTLVEENKALQTKIKDLTESRDHLIYQLYKKV